MRWVLSSQNAGLTTQHYLKDKPSATLSRAKYHGLLWIEFYRLSFSRTISPTAESDKLRRGSELTPRQSEQFLRTSRQPQVCCVTQHLIIQRQGLSGLGITLTVSSAVSTVLAAGKSGSRVLKEIESVNQLFFKDRKELIRFVSRVTLSWYWREDKEPPGYLAQIALFQCIEKMSEWCLLLIWL